MIECQKKVLVVFFLSVILIDSVFETGENYYPLGYQKNVNTLAKKKRSKKYIEDIEIFSEDSDEEISDEEQFGV